MVITSKPYVDKLEWGAKLLDKWFLEIVLLSKKKVSIGEPKPRERPKKQIVVEKTAILESQGKVKEVAMSMTKFSSKISKPISYNEAVNDLIHGRRWQEAIEDKLQNLENHQTWEYDKLPLEQKAIRSK